ncbi:MAG: DUF4433 domain-containing protein [Cyanobacteriota bacterium]|nr:DUF4433 domain-containing protein [Cyanobacteriota bacterium]
MIKHLFHITHLDNLPGILGRGLLCRNRMEDLQLTYIDLSDADCQTRRSWKALDGRGVDLHNYVPLFIKPRNAMLYRLQKSLGESGAADALAILEVNADVAQWGASLLADGIASSPVTQLFHARDAAGWQALDWKAIRCRCWLDQPDPQAAKRRMMAEVMVNGQLQRRHIQKVWLKSSSALEELRARLGVDAVPVAAVDQERRLFF